MSTPRRYNHLPTASSSVQYVGKYDPLSMRDVMRRAEERGNVVDLISTSSVAQSSTSNKRSRTEENKFSVPGGKRRCVSICTTNIATQARPFEMRWGEGAFRWVHKGRYETDIRTGFTGGAQNGQLCVQKEFKTGSVFEDTYFDKDIRAVEKASEIIQRFNSHMASRNVPGAKTIHLNQPTVFTDMYPDSTGKYKKSLVEPMLEGEFLKFNSNSGYTNGAEFMQALSHYSYHMTNGKHLLCDLQGGHYEDAYILTDPVIMSHDNSKAYGSGDLGSEGIDNFFAHHRCNKYCCHSWRKPHQPRVSSRIPRAASTSFSLTLGTLKSDQERKKELLKKINQQWGLH